MKKYLSSGVKAVIGEHPEVGRILDEFKVGCTTCAVGTCLLKDVVGIHNLAPSDETELMYRIEKAIYPDRLLETRAVTESVKAAPLQFSPPVQALVNEHSVIKRWLTLIPKVVDALHTDSEHAWQWVVKGADLIKNYADRYHHAKEEDVLFKYVEESSEIIQAMYEEHRIGRGHRQEVSDAIATRDKEKAAKHLLAFRELLSEHIRKEDEILYPWIDRGLSMRQVGEMYAKFASTDTNSTLDAQEYLDFIIELEERLS